MGMAASQGRYLFLTARNSNIMLDLNLCSNEKRALTRESRNIAEEYQQGMNAKKFVWSNNQGVTYQELSYSMLTSPNAANGKQPYMVTDLNDRVVLNKKFAEIVEKYSVDGKFDWDNNREKILSELTGISESRLLNCQTSDQKLQDAYETMMAAKAEMEKYSADCSKMCSISDFIKNNLSGVNFDSGDGLSFSSGSNLADAYKNGAYVDISLKAGEVDAGAEEHKLQNIIALYDAMAELMPDPEAFAAAADSLINYDEHSGLYINKLGQKIEEGDSNSAMYGESGKYKVDIQKLTDQLIRVYKSKIGADPSLKQITYLDKTAPEYLDYLDAKAVYDTAKSAYNKALSDNTGLLTAEEEQKFAYYDAMFSTIAEQGWVYNSKVNDPEYLNEMLQNNLFTLTTVEDTEQYDARENAYVNKKIYTTNFAANCSKLICVTDTEAQEEATTKYEYEKAIINEKESRIDERMSILQTELQANNAQKEALKTIIQENTDRNFKIFA